MRGWNAVTLFALAAALTAQAEPAHALVDAALFRLAPNSKPGPANNLAPNSNLAPSNEPTVEDLKARLASAGSGDRPHLCVQIAQKRLAEADRLYVADDVEKGQAALADVVAYMEQARDYAIQSGKYQKQTEITARTMTRKLTDLVHTLSHDDQPPVREAITRLEKVRDDLLKAMFPKGAK